MTARRLYEEILTTTESPLFNADEREAATVTAAFYLRDAEAGSADAQSCLSQLAVAQARTLRNRLAGRLRDEAAEIRDRQGYLRNLADQGLLPSRAATRALARLGRQLAEIEDRIGSLQ